MKSSLLSNEGRDKVNSFILDTHYDGLFFLDDMVLKAYSKGRHFANVGLQNVGDRTLIVFLSPSGIPLASAQKRIVRPGDFAKFRKVLHGRVTIQWHQAE